MKIVQQPEAKPCWDSYPYYTHHLWGTSLRPQHESRGIQPSAEPPIQNNDGFYESLQATITVVVGCCSWLSPKHKPENSIFLLQ